jgi:hypothetical protein
MGRQAGVVAGAVFALFASACSPFSAAIAMQQGGNPALSISETALVAAARAPHTSAQAAVAAPSEAPADATCLSSGPVTDYPSPSLPALPSPSVAPPPETSAASLSPATTIPPASTEPTASSSPSSGQSIPMSEAWGNVPVHSIPNSLGTDRVLLIDYAATSDGNWLVGVSQPRNFGSEAGSPEYSDAVLVRVSNGEVRTMAKLATPSSQVFFAASDGPWVVWTETDGEPNFYDWRLRVYNLETGTTRELARATHKNGAVLEGPWPVPYVSHDVAVWGQTVGPLEGPDQLKNAVSLGADLRTGKVTTLADHSGLPSISWPWISWQVNDATDHYTRFENLETGEQRRLEGLTLTLAIDGNSAAYNTRALNPVCLIEDLATNGSSRIVANEPDGLYEWITLNDRVVAYFQHSEATSFFDLPTQVYDRLLKSLVDLPMSVSHTHSGTRALGPLVVWSTPLDSDDSGPALYQVVDTRDIKQ